VGPTLRKHHLNYLGAVSLASVMIDRRPQILELPPSRRVGRTGPCILSTSITTDSGQHIVAPESEQSINPTLRLVRTSVLRDHVASIECENIYDRDASWITDAFRRRGDVLFGKIFAQGPLSFSKIGSAAARAALIAAVSDDIDGGVRDATSLVPAGRSEPQPGPFACKRHAALIFSISPSVV
jgi:hypothetical protein